MVERVPTMSDAEHTEFLRLQALHDEIADSRDSLLGAGSLAPIAGTAVLSTVTVVATAVIQHYVQRML